MTSRKPPFLLVHGAWHGGWCWNRVVPLLQAAGHHALPVTLTGLGDRAHLMSPSINLDTHITDVVSTLEMEDLNDVVLVGHSLGGMVISGAAERVSKKIRRLVYLDALVPKHGQSAFDLNSAEFRSKLERQANEKGDGYKIAPIVDMLGITNAEDLAWVHPRLRPQPIATFSQSVDAPSFASRIPSTFILCKQFGFGATAERCCQSGWPVQEIDCGHDAMMIKPAELSELLISASH